MKVSRKSWHYRWMKFVFSDEYMEASDAGYIFGFVFSILLSPLLAPAALIDAWMKKPHSRVEYTD
jgi:hypothetical protein